MSNHFTITGHLASDPDLKFIPSGKPVCNGTVCDTPRKFNKDTQQWEDSGDTIFMRFALWGEDGELAAETLTRGQKVTVTGRLVARSYEKDGATVNVMECQADSVAPHARSNQAQRDTGQVQQGQADPWATESAPF